MTARRAFVLAGSLWETTRFFIVISLLVLLFRSAGEGGAWIIPWLLLGGTGNLLVAVGGIMLSLYPQTYGQLIGFLRLGKILSIFSFLLLILSGAVGMSAAVELVKIGAYGVDQGAVLFAIFILDLLFLAALVAWRKEPQPAA
ncbi:MAG TPA: hypothetical protein VMV03_12925 [Spirochaetia bacterium]|nr:hypothetical protein [Spirochaetia bacterium]